MNGSPNRRRRGTLAVAAVDKEAMLMQNFDDVIDAFQQQRKQVMEKSRDIASIHKERAVSLGANDLSPGTRFRSPSKLYQPNFLVPIIDQEHSLASMPRTSNLRHLQQPTLYTEQEVDQLKA